MPDLTDLDGRIRALVGRAVADAPPPPDLAPGQGSDTAVPLDGPGPDRRRRWLAGGAVAIGVAAAAAVAAIVVVDGEPHTVTTDTSPPTATSPVAPTTGPPSTAVAPTSTVPPTTTPAPTPAFGSFAVSAGPGGIRVEQPPGVPVGMWLDTPADIALAVGDGRVVVLPSGARTPELWTLADEAVVPLLAGAGGQVELHDTAVVDGRPVLLYSVTSGTTPDDSREDLFVLDIDAGTAPVAIEQTGGWEWGTRRLHLAANGLIVGESSSEIYHSLFVSAIPGSEGAALVPTLTPAALGIDDEYAECDECPRLYTIEDHGTALAWLERGELVEWDIGLRTTRRTPLAVDLAYVADIDLSVDALAISYAQLPDEPARPAVIVPLPGGGPPSTPDALGLTLTLGPSLPASGEEDRPPLTTVPATTTSVLPPPPAPVRLASAGAGGMAVIEHGEEVRRLEQPAEIALLTPGGAVIFQPPRTDPSAAPGPPQIWRPDGSVEPFLSALPDGGWYRLHDVATIEGTPTVLYGIRTIGAAPEQQTETVRALFMDPAGWRTVDVGTFLAYEAGISRLSLSTDGLVVGSRSESVTSSYLALAVPGTTAAGWTDVDTPPAGVDAAGYVDCLTCPSAFTVSADGESLVWVVDDEIRVEDRPSGQQRSWPVPELAAHPIRSLDARTSSDGGVEVAISFGWPDLDGPSAIVIATAPSGGVATTPVEGARLVTFGP